MSHDDNTTHVPKEPDPIAVREVADRLIAIGQMGRHLLSDKIALDDAVELSDELMVHVHRWAL